MSRFHWTLSVMLVFSLAAGWTSTTRAQVGKSLDPPILEVNTASKDDLLKAPHMTEAIVDELIAKRPFLNIKDVNTFLASKMLSADQLKEVYVRVFLHVNLNTADKEELMLIPGMSDRMTGEYDEYRPYTDFDKFRREIGKYVGPEQVAKWEQYVFVPINLDTASEEVLKTIPGLSERMLDELKEYRPYNTDVEKFKREIGKYVEPKELDRLLRYTTLAPKPAAEAPAAPARGRGRGRGN